MSPGGVATGLDRLVDERFARLQGRKLGAICNPTSIDRRFRHIADLLHSAPGVELLALFGPEHGVRGEAQDMEALDHSIDPATRTPIHSLYGAGVSSLRPGPGQLDGLDLLIFDVQDVGSRYYTFAATMLYAMEEAASHGIGFLVLDRPNPINGLDLEGPTVREGYESFVSAYPMPVRHGMTVGELARLFHAELKFDLELEVVPCGGWRRSMFWADTGLPWVAPSPNMPTPTTALVYPGACLLEGTNLSEGRGTTRPFELWGAPWLDGERLAAGMSDHPGVALRPCTFRPMFHKHAGQACGGVQPHILAAREFRSLELYLELIARARLQAPERFAWRTEPYEFVSHPIAIDLLLGSSRERLLIESGETSPWRDMATRWDAFGESWSRDCAEFHSRREPMLLYA